MSSSPFAAIQPLLGLLFILLFVGIAVYTVRTSIRSAREYAAGKDDDRYWAKVAGCIVVSTLAGALFFGLAALVLSSWMIPTAPYAEGAGLALFLFALCAAGVGAVATLALLIFFLVIRPKRLRAKGQRAAQRVN